MNSHITVKTTAELAGDDLLDVLVIGSGPAGLSAAVYTSRAGLSTVILAGGTAGGLLTTTEQVDNYLGLFGTKGIDMAEIFMKHAKEFGAELKYSTAHMINQGADGLYTVETHEGETFFAKTVIYAAGSVPRKLQVSGEELEGVSWCATCDGLFQAGEDVAVVGGGETAVEDALYMAGLAKSVRVLVRGKDFRATAPQVALLASKENVTISYETSVKEIFGEDGLVDGVRLSTGEELAVTGLFIAVGQIPQSHLAERHTTLYADEFIESSVAEGFFVAGDVMNPQYRQVAVAVGEGAKAGIDATNYILALG